MIFFRFLLFEFHTRKSACFVIEWIYKRTREPRQFPQLSILVPHLLNSRGRNAAWICLVYRSCLIDDSRRGNMTCHGIRVHMPVRATRLTNDEAGRFATLYAERCATFLAVQQCARHMLRLERSSIVSRKNVELERTSSLVKCQPTVVIEVRKRRWRVLCCDFFFPFFVFCFRREIGKVGWIVCRALLDPLS